MASDLPMRIQLNSVLFGVVVDVCCHKQDSPMRGGLRDKGTSTLSATNYITVDIVDDTLTVIDNKARYWSSIATFAFTTCIRRPG